MSKNIVLIPGALATPKLWQHLEKHVQSGRIFHHVNVLHSDSITELAAGFAKNAPDKCTVIGFSMGGYVALELFNHIKTEHVYFEFHKTRNQAKKSIFKHMEVFYNRKRRHSTLNYYSPMTFEENWGQQKNISLLTVY